MWNRFNFANKSTVDKDQLLLNDNLLWYTDHGPLRN